MKKEVLTLLALVTTSCGTSPEWAARQTCNCLQETATLWQDDKKADAVVKFVDCGQMQEDYKREFSGRDLATFNRAYNECLRETIKGEMLRYFLK